MTDSAASFQQFLLWERASRDTLEVKRTYIDMAGDLVAGVVLSQIVYWHLPNRDGKAKLQVEREGKLWLAKSRTDWWQECRISPKQADRALEVLKERGLIEVRVFKFGSAPTKHVRIREAEFLRAWGSQIANSSGEPGPNGGGGGTDFPQRSKSISPKGEDRNSPKRENPIPLMGNNDLPERARTLDTKITTENTASSDQSSDADAALVEALMKEGVGRTVAKRLAALKPEACRRCLEYLPFAKIRTSKGAWLANAIRDEYGPPPGYERHERSQELTRVEMTRQSHEASRRKEKEDRLGAMLRRMKETHGEAYTAFNTHLEREREKASRIVEKLSEQGKGRYLMAFDDPKRRLELFDAWLKGEGKFMLKGDRSLARPLRDETEEETCFKAQVS